MAKKPVPEDFDLIEETEEDPIEVPVVEEEEAPKKKRGRPKSDNEPADMYVVIDWQKSDGCPCRNMAQVRKAVRESLETEGKPEIYRLGKRMQFTYTMKAKVDII